MSHGSEGMLADDATPDASAAASATAAALYKEAASNVRSSMTTSSQQLMKGGNDALTATEHALKAGGRVAMATVGMLTGALNGASLFTAGTGAAMADGMQRVNQMTERMPVLGTVTTGVQRSLTGVSDVFRQNAEFSIKGRNKFVDDMIAKLDEFDPNKRAAADSTPPAAS